MDAAEAAELARAARLTPVLKAIYGEIKLQALQGRNTLQYPCAYETWLGLRSTLELQGYIVHYGVGEHGWPEPNTMRIRW